MLKAKNGVFTEDSAHYKNMIFVIFSVPLNLYRETVSQFFLNLFKGINHIAHICDE